MSENSIWNWNLFRIHIRKCVKGSLSVESVEGIDCFGLMNLCKAEECIGKPFGGGNRVVGR